MANENEDSFADDPLEEINLDDDDLDDLLGDSDEEDKNDDASEDTEADLLSDDDLLEVASDDTDSGDEISEEELDSLLAEADSPAEDSGDEDEPAELSADELDALLADDEGEDATDVLGEEDIPAELPEVPDSLPENLVSELEDDLPAEEEEETVDEDSGVDTEMLLDESEEEEKSPAKKKSFKAPKKGKKGKKSKGFAAKDGSSKPKKAPRAVPAKAAKSSGNKLDFICSECYSVLALSATYSEEIVTCPECFHVGKKPDDSFLRTVSTAKGGERKKALVLTLLSCLLIISFCGVLFLDSAYGDAEARTEADLSVKIEGKKAAGEDTSKEALEKAGLVYNDVDEKHKDSVGTWQMIFSISGGIFLLLLIWQAFVFEGNRWEAYF